MPPTSSNRFAVEIDGFPRMRAVNVDFGEGKRGNLHQHQPGNQLSPTYGASTVTVDEVTVRHATGDGDVEDRYDAWFDRFHAGLDAKRNVRVIEYDRTGRVPRRTWELLNCCPTGISPEEKSGGESDRAAEFSFRLQPEELRVL